MNLDDATVARCDERSRDRIDRHAVANHSLREHWIGHIVQRHDDARQRRAQHQVRRLAHLNSPVRALSCRRATDAYDATMRTVLSVTRRRFILAVCAVELACVIVAGSSQTLPDASHLERLRAYIKMSWTTLSRSNRDLPQA